MLEDCIERVLDVINNDMVDEELDFVDEQYKEENKPVSVSYMRSANMSNIYVRSKLTDFNT